MIARIWRGITLADKADAYVDYLNETGLKDYAKTPGNQGVTVLRRLQGEHCEIVLISLWDSMAAVRAFAGENPERSRLLPRGRAVPARDGAARAALRSRRADHAGRCRSEGRRADRAREGLARAFSSASAQSTAASAWMRAVSNTGTLVSSAPTRRPISVQPRISAFGAARDEIRHDRAIRRARRFADHAEAKLVVDDAMDFACARRHPARAPRGRFVRAGRGRNPAPS